MHKPKRFLTLPEPITEAQAEVFRSKEWQKIIRKRGYSPPRQFVQPRKFKARQDELKVITEEKKEEDGPGTLKEPEAIASSSSKDSGGSGGDGHFVPPGPWTLKEEEVEVDKKVVKLFKKPEVPPSKPQENPSSKTIKEIGTERDCRSVRKKNGFVITTLAGFEDQSPLKPIPMVNPKKGRYEKLRHPRWELQPHQFYKVKLGMIKDPLFFYLEMVREPPKDNCQSWEECLNHFYNQPGVAEQYKMRSTYPFQGQQYAVYTPELKLWERVRIHAFHFHEGPFISGLYLDRNEPFVRVPFQSLNLHELHPYYARWPKYPVRAGLLDIRPVKHYLQKKEEGPFVWPKYSIEYFKQMVQDKELWCWIEDIGFDKIDGRIHGSQDDMNAMATVILFDKVDRLLPINVWLVLRGLAAGIKDFKDARLTAYNLLGLERYLKELEITKQFWQTVEKEPEERVKVGWIKERDEQELEEMFGKGAGQPIWVSRE